MPAIYCPDLPRFPNPVGKIWDRLAKVDGDGLKRLMTERDYMKTWRFVETELPAL